MRLRAVPDEALYHYRVHSLEALQADGVVCLECGAVRQALGTHVHQHGMTLTDYRGKWGYNRQTALVTPALREARRQEALARNVGALGPPEALQAGGCRAAVCRAREGIAYLWIEAWGRSGRPLAPVLRACPQSVYAAAQRGRRARAQWDRVMATRRI